MPVRKNYIITTIILAITLFGILYVSKQQRIKPNHIDLATIPLTIDRWEGKDIELSKRTLEVLGTEDALMREYVDPDGNSIYLYVVYSDSNRDAFHPPELCYTGDGAEVMEQGYEKVSIGDKGEALNTNRLLFKDKQGKELVWYYFTVGKRIIPNFYKQQFYYILNELSFKRSGGAMVRISTLVRGNNVKKAESLGQEFIKKVAPILSENLS